MSDVSGQHSWTQEEADEASDADRRLGPLQSAALGGLVVGLLFLVVAAAWLENAQNSGNDASLWGPVVCFLFAFGAFGWGGLATLAFWVCRAVLSR